MPENEASIRLLRNLGFVAECVFQERSFWKGAFRDLVMCALLQEHMGELMAGVCPDRQ